MFLNSKKIILNPSLPLSIRRFKYSEFLFLITWRLPLFTCILVALKKNLLFFKENVFLHQPLFVILSNQRFYGNIIILFRLCTHREAGGGYLALTRVQESLEELEDVYDDWDDDPKARQPSMDDMLNDLIGDLGLYILMCWFETM